MCKFRDASDIEFLWLLFFDMRLFLGGYDMRLWVTVVFSLFIELLFFSFLF